MIFVPICCAQYNDCDDENLVARIPMQKLVYIVWIVCFEQ